MAWTNSFIEIQWAFTKWFIDDKGRNKIPLQFSWYSRNCRIQNASTTIRRWPLSMYSLPTPIQWLHMKNSWTGILVVANWNLYLWTSLIGPVPNIWKVNFIDYGKYTILLTGMKPYVYENLTNLLYVVPDANLIASNMVWQIPEPDPILWASLTWFTFIANNHSKNILHISKPVVPDTPQNAYDRSNVSWLDDRYADMWENREMTSDIVWIIANLQYLYIFCQRTIEVIERWSVQNFQSKWYTTSVPIGDWDRLANDRAVTCAWQRIFYFTKSLEWKTINHEAGIEFPMIWELSNRKWQSIQWWLRDNLDQQQNNAFMVYDHRENCVELYCASKGMWYNNLRIVYDIVNDTFVSVDDGIAMTIAHWDYDYSSWNQWIYLANSINGAIYHDDQLLFDNYAPSAIPSATASTIKFEYNTPNMALWDPTREKLWRWFWISGWWNTATELTIEWYIDWKLEFTKVINRTQMKSSEIKNVNIWWNDMNADSDEKMNMFDYVADHWKMRKKWKRMRIKIKSNKMSSNFYFDSLSINAMATGNAELNDKY